MIKVAFWFDAPVEYSGGYNYIKNLIFASYQLKDKEIQFFIFFSNDVLDENLNSFRPYATVVKTSILRRYSFFWFLNKILNRLFNSSFLLNTILKRHEIDILSHNWDIIYGLPKVKVLSWIPDFQYLHLPEFFPELNLKVQNKKNISLVEKSELVILSSKDAQKDLESIIPLNLLEKSRVLQFVSQPKNEYISKKSNKNLDKILSKDYFFLPNQFWRHKNHIVVFKAVKFLKDQGCEVNIVCTGNLKDLRTKDNSYLSSLKEYINTQKIGPNINILGMVQYIDVLTLMRNSKAIINPSKFEGWSSTVEEAKSMGKLSILSNIPVHKEQNPLNSIFFEQDDEEELASILNNIQNDYDHIAQDNFKDLAEDDLKKRTVKFGQEYISLIKEVHESKLKK